MKKDKTNGGFTVVTEKTKGKSIYRTVMLMILVAFISFFVTTIGMYSYFANNSSNFMNLTTFLSKETNEKELAKKLAAYKKIIDERYLGEVDEKALEESAIKGYIEGLNDEYTKYISKEEMKDYKEDLQGEFVGVGIYMMKDKNSGKIKVLLPIKDGPAQRAGIQSGDIIKSVNGVEYTAEQLEQLSEDIKGQEGTDVTIEIIRGEENLTFNLKRENVVLNPVETKILENNIGYLAFSSFDQNTTNEFKNKYQELKEKGISALIIDIRNNGGGIVDQAKEIAGCILDKDSTVLFEVDKKRK